MIDSINKKGGSAKYTQYGAMGHNCWDRAYGEGEIFQWMLNNHRSSKYSGTMTYKPKPVAAAPTRSVSKVPSVQSLSDNPAKAQKKTPPPEMMPVW